MSADPYAILGVPRTASQEEIRKAYRALAKKYHPDLNPANREAEAKFKEIANAYAILGDPEKRARFDRGEIDAEGQERPRPEYFYRDFAHGAGAGMGGGEAGFDAEEILAELFGRGARLRMRGQDIHAQIEIPFIEAYHGGVRQLALPDGSKVEVKIPPGVRNGEILRLRGKGMPGLGGGPPGDLLIEVAVAPDPRFTLKGDDIYIDQAVPLAEAVLGGRIQVPTPSGAVMVRVPPWSSSGTVLRLRGKGYPKRGGGGHGDAYVTLRITLPTPPDPELESLLRRWAEARGEKAGKEA